MRINLFKKVFAFITAACMALSVNTAVIVKAEDVDTMSATEIAKDMLVGWNLGNSLESRVQAYYSPTNSETAWGNPVTTSALIDKIKSAGFNTVRIPVTWYDKCDENGNIRAEWMNRVKEVVDYAYNNDMYVILNTHHELLEGNNTNDGWLCPDYAHKEQNIDKLNSLWQQIANEFKDYNRRLIFETMNEPRVIGGENEWNGGTTETRNVINELNKQAADTIRESGGNNKNRIIMCPGNAASLVSVLKDDFVLPYEGDDENIVVSVHNYSPYDFAQAGKSGWGSDEDKNALENELKSLYRKFVSKGIPVIIGEMGASYFPEHDADRIKWAYFYSNTAKKYSIPCVIWDNNYAQNSGGTENYGLLDRNTLTWKFESLVNAFVKGANDESDEPEIIDPYNEVLFNGSVSSTQSWSQPWKILLYNLEPIKEGASIIVEYSSAQEPWLCFNDYQGGENNWNSFEPDSVSDGIATYNYSTFSKCKTPFSEQDEMLLMNKEASITVKKITLSYPVALGDIKIDTYINKKDTAKLLKDVLYQNSFTEMYKSYADVNKDGVVNIIDAIKIFLL